jgi:hypothetical protein
MSVNKVNQRRVSMDDFFAKCGNKSYLRHGLGRGQNR